MTLLACRCIASSEAGQCGAAARCRLGAAGISAQGCLKDPWQSTQYPSGFVNCQTEQPLQPVFLSFIRRHPGSHHMNSKSRTGLPTFAKGLGVRSFQPYWALRTCSAVTRRNLEMFLASYFPKGYSQGRRAKWPQSDAWPRCWVCARLGWFQGKPTPPHPFSSIEIPV